MATISVLRKPKSESQISDDVQSEVARFSSILKRLERSTNPERVSLRQVLVEYILFSPNSTELISTLILSCLSMKSPDRLDIAIDILSQVKHNISIRAIGRFSLTRSRRNPGAASRARKRADAQPECRLQRGRRDGRRGALRRHRRTARTQQHQ